MFLASFLFRRRVWSCSCHTQTRCSWIARSIGSAALVTLLTSVTAYAQGVLGVDPTGRSSNAPALLPKELKESPAAPEQTLPPLSPPSTEQTQRLPLLHVHVREIRVTGSTIFAPEELAQITAPYKREVTSIDLEELRLALTREYVKRGYVTSGVIIPDQTVTDGVITLQALEGTLANVEVEGTRWFRSQYIADRLTQGVGPPVNREALAERLQLLQQEGNIRRLDAALRPGVRLGESILSVRVEEAPPYSLLLGFNNYQSPTIGAEHGLVSAVWRSLTGRGDPFSVTYGLSSGVQPQIDTSYSLPLNAHETRISLRFRKNDFSVVEAPFDALDVESESEIYAITLRHPFIRTLRREFALSLIGEHLRNKTFLLGEPFSFSEGAQNGKSVVSALRVALEWTERSQQQALAARSQFSVGVDVLDATNNSSRIADGQFFSWLGQFQWARRWNLRNLQTIFRLDVQLTDAPLLSLEQLAVGGRYSVRGYRENQLVRDNGIISSLEARVPLLRQPTRWATTLELAPFVDVGRAWNKKGSTSHPDTIASIGLGLRWATSLAYPLFPSYSLELTPQFEVYWGHPLHDVETSGGDVQDEGVHLQLLLAVF